MRNLKRKSTPQRAMILTFSTNECICTGACNCPGYPTHQIGVGVREQGKDSVATRA